GVEPALHAATGILVEGNHLCHGVDTSACSVAWVGQCPRRTVRRPGGHVPPTRRTSLVRPGASVTLDGRVLIGILALPTGECKQQERPDPARDAADLRSGQRSRGPPARLPHGAVEDAPTI